jgi:hypothetical protein
MFVILFLDGLIEAEAPEAQQKRKTPASKGSPPAGACSPDSHLQATFQISDLMVWRMQMQRKWQCQGQGQGQEEQGQGQAVHQVSMQFHVQLYGQLQL